MKTKELEDKIATVVDAWASLRPTKSFFGMTLDEFKTAIKPSLDARGTVTEVRNNLTAALVQRDDADTASWPLVQSVVFAVMADKDEGPDGELYKAMGYVRMSERASGLTRGASNGVTQPQMAKAA